MFSFSKRSAANLSSAHPELQRLFNAVIEVIDCTVIYGHRTREQQSDMVEQGYSKLHFPSSMHNSKPSLACDVVPYPIDWHDRERFVYFAGVVKGMAAVMDIPIRWGGDWDGDNQLHDQTWMDLPHFELKDALLKDAFDRRDRDE